ncbi:hypothetical protein GXW82_32270 [Streptacidiphilus sp. 4-A2]|nr:hypothetical protein [Streptacidiphilus sp. 4-A2]
MALANPPAGPRPRIKGPNQAFKEELDRLIDEQLFPSDRTPSDRITSDRTPFDRTPTVPTRPAAALITAPAAESR